MRSLPSAELERLEPYMRVVPLPFGERLTGMQEPLPQIYFPLDGAISRLSQLKSGETVEVGLVGNDGALGVRMALGASHGIGQSRVQVPGNAAAMTAEDFREHVLDSGGPLIRALLLYANLQLQIVTQLAACHCLHRIEQRLSRCILSLADHNGSSESVRITHDMLAEFLGVHRPSVSYALQALAQTGAIGSGRRRIVVYDRDLLEQHACECYATIKEYTARELRRLRQPAS